MGYKVSLIIKKNREKEIMNLNLLTDKFNNN